MDYVKTVIADASYGEPLTTAGITAGFADAFQMDPDRARGTVNVYLKRLADQKLVFRLMKGVYAKAHKTVFGMAIPDKEKIIAETFLRDGAEVIGYETGATALNRMGLSTLIPRDRQIATNRYRCAVPDGARIVRERPLATVTTDNARYLQLIATIRAMRRYPIDADNPDVLIYDVIRRLKLNDTELVRHANAYLNNDELRMVLRIVFGELGNIEAA
jgi:hypothetical protein